MKNTNQLCTISNLDLVAVTGGVSIGGMLQGAGRILSTAAHDAEIGAVLGGAGGAAVGAVTGPGMVASAGIGGAGGGLAGAAFGLGRGIGNEIAR